MLRLKKSSLLKFLFLVLTSLLQALNLNPLNSLGNQHLSVRVVIAIALPVKGASWDIYQ
jgi:hypothetical protein